MKNDDEVLRMLLVGGIITPIIAVAIFVFGLGGILFEAWVITQLWDWFVVPTFNMSSISVVVAFGLNLLVALFTNHFRPAPKETSKLVLLDLGCHVYVRPFICLCLGYVAYTYFM